MQTWLWHIFVQSQKEFRSDYSAQISIVVYQYHSNLPTKLKDIVENYAGVCVRLRTPPHCKERCMGDPTGLPGCFNSMYAPGGVSKSSHIPVVAVEVVALQLH